jgi:uracil permease
MAAIGWDAAIVSLVAAIIAMLAGTKTIRLFPIIIGLVVGYVYSAVRRYIDNYPHGKGNSSI